MSEPPACSTLGLSHILTYRSRMQQIKQSKQFNFKLIVYPKNTSFQCICEKTITVCLNLRLLHRMLRAPMSFFDTTPIGRIVNRFSKDVDTVDMNIPMTIRIFMSASASVIATIIIISYSTPIFLSVVLPLGLLYYFVQVMSPFQFCSTISYR